MAIVKFKHSLSHYLKLFDKRKADGDMLGALDAGRNAIKYAKTKIDKNSINMLLGEAYFQMGLHTLSCEHYFRAVGVRETCAGAYFGVARNLVFLNRFELSLDYFEKTLEWDVLNVFSQAVYDWAEYIKSQLKNKEEEQNFGIQEVEECLKNKNFKTALNVCEKLLTKMPNDNQVLTFYAKCLFYLKDVDKSRQILKTVLKDEPTNVSAILFLCLICLCDEDFTSFFTLINHVDKNAVNDGQLMFYAKLVANAFMFDEAIDCFEKLSTKKPYSTKIFLYLAICYHNKGLKEEALYNLAKARWIDYENPTLLEYYRILNTSTDVLALSDAIPQQVQTQKLEKLNALLNNPNFVTDWTKSATLSDETDWLLTTNNFVEGEMLAGHLGNAKNKKAKNYCKKVLLSVRPNLKQKFLLTREILRGQRHKVVELTTNLTYRSFSFKLSKALNCIALFKNAITNAWAYVQCYANRCNINKKAEQLCRLVLENNLQSKLDENVFTCLMFIDEISEINRVCKYFGVDVADLENAKYLLKIN